MVGVQLAAELVEARIDLDRVDVLDAVGERDGTSVPLPAPMIRTRLNAPGNSS